MLGHHAGPRKSEAPEPMRLVAFHSHPEYVTNSKLSGFIKKLWTTWQESKNQPGTRPSEIASMIFAWLNSRIKSTENANFKPFCAILRLIRPLRLS